MERTLTIVALSGGLIGWVMAIFFTLIMSIVLFAERHAYPGLVYGYIGAFIFLLLTFLWILKRTQYFGTLFR
jgi:hypothetical protein